MRRFLCWFPVAALLAALSADPIRSQASDATFAVLRATDLRLATIGYRLITANAPLCAAKGSATGLVLHDIAQYEQGVRGEAKRFFGFEAPIGVEAVVAGSPADTAGVRAGDSLRAIDGKDVGVAFPSRKDRPTTERALAVDARVQNAGEDGVIRLSMLRGGQEVEADIRPLPACRTRFELSLASAYNSEADGSIVQISAKMFEAFRSEDEAAYILGHELAHNMLRHRDRLDAAGVKRGILESIGRSVGYIRRSEVEADIVGVVAAANAGFDPAAAAGFWRWFGPAHLNSIFLARTHPRWSTRVKLLDRETAALARVSVRPFRPPLLDTVDQPMSNDWQSLLAGL